MHWPMTMDEAPRMKPRPPLSWQTCGRLPLDQVHWWFERVGLQQALFTQLHPTCPNCARLHIPWSHGSMVTSEAPPRCFAPRSRGSVHLRASRPQFTGHYVRYSTRDVPDLIESCSIYICQFVNYLPWLWHQASIFDNSSVSTIIMWAILRRLHVCLHSVQGIHADVLHHASLSADLPLDSHCQRLSG